MIYKFVKTNNLRFNESKFELKYKNNQKLKDKILQNIHLSVYAIHFKRYLFILFTDIYYKQYK